MTAGLRYFIMEPRVFGSSQGVEYMLIKGEAIRTARLCKRLSQRELAHGICAQATVCLIEKYDQNVAWDIINGLCQRLEIRV